MSAWKDLERRTAAALNGKRNKRGGDFSEKMADVSHDMFSIECKYRQKLPRLLRLGLAQAQKYDPTKPALLVIRERYQRGALAVLKLDDFVDLLQRISIPQLRHPPRDHADELSMPVFFNTKKALERCS